MKGRTEFYHSYNQVNEHEYYSEWICTSPGTPIAAKIGKTFAYSLILVISLVGNSLIVIIVYKFHAMRKPINYFIASMALSDLLYSIFVLPQRLTELYVDAWPIGGSHGQVLCTMFPFIIDVSTVVSIPSLVLIAVERFGAVVFPLGSLLISSKRCPFFILTTWIVAVAISSPYLVAFKLVEYPGKLV